jgi:hypothetical protein
VRLLAVLAAVMLLSGTDRAEADDSIPTAWQLQAGTAGLLTAPPPPEPATICIIDTGVTPTPDLTITARSSTLPGTLDDVTAKPGHPGHGTTVAHFAAAAVNGWGGSGAFPYARISSVRVFPEEGGTTWEAYASALDRCSHIDRRTKVVVIALGGKDAGPGEVQEITNRIERMRRTYGLSVVAAAGNGGGLSDYPGRIDAALTVAAADLDGSLCAFSARGVGVDIAAPGCSLEQGGWDGVSWGFEGSSFAAPIVAGALAAVRSYRPDLSVSEAEALLLSAARAGSVPLLDVHRLQSALGLPDHAAQGAVSAHDPPGDAVSKARPVAEPGVHQAPQAPVSRPHVRARPVRPRSSLSTPRGGVRRVSRRFVAVHVTNRPRRVHLEVQIGRRRVRTLRDRIRVRYLGRRAIRVRYLGEFRTSGWVSLRIPRT